MNNIFTRGCMLIVLAWATTTVLASNFSFLNESPIRYFNNQDWTLLNQAQEKALTQTPNNKKVTWKNPNKNHGGYFIPLNTTHLHGTTCRTLKIYNEAEGLSSLVDFHYCKINGAWKITH